MYKISTIFPRFYARLFHKALFVALLLIIVPSAVAQMSSTIIHVGSFEQEVGDVIGKIEKQTNYRFAHDFDLNLSRKVMPAEETMTLVELLEVILEGTNLTYKVAINTVILADRPVDTVESAAKTVGEQIPQWGELYMSVLSEQQKSELPNAIIVLTNSSDSLVYRTDKRGRVDIKLIAGSYGVSISHPTHIEYSDSIEIVAGYNNFIFELNSMEVGQVPAAELIYESSKSKRPAIDRDALLLSVSEPIKQRAPLVSVKTNLLYGATAAINLGFEFRLSQRLSLELPLSYNPWTFSGNKKLKHLLTQPELRYWTREVFNGHFVGLHAHFAHFNVGGVNAPFNIWDGLKNSRYQGNLYGAGLSYGYQFIIGHRWSMELTAGLGYFHAKYNRFGCKTCGEHKRAGIKNYFGPTKLELSFIFIIK